MKRVILVAIIALTISLHTYAQFTIGPKAGLNLSKVYEKSWGGSDFSDYKTGFNAGVFGKYALSNSFDIKAELLYSQQGYKSDFITEVDFNGYIIESINTRKDYLNIPLLLKYNLLGRPWIFFEAGPQIGFCLGQHHSYNDKEIEDALNEYSTYKTVDFSLSGGIGFYLGSGISINARYNHGLTNSEKYDLNLKNRVFQFSMAYDLWKF